jgi:hypothetical protein
VLRLFRAKRRMEGEGMKVGQYHAVPGE